MKLLLFLFVLLSCSHVEFINTSKVPVNFTGQSGHELEYEKEIEANFYLWGTLPKKIVIDFQQIADEYDLQSIASLKIKRVNKISSLLWPILSVGFVVPKYYVLTFKAPEESLF